MDYYQGVVYDYLQQVDGAMFIKAECPIQLDEGKIPPKGTSWICDALAVNLREHKAYLCEVSYSNTLHALAKRLEEWSKEWPRLRAAIVRDLSIPKEWDVQPWLFVPAHLREKLDTKLLALANSSSNVGTAAMPTPRVDSLESVAPWNYKPFSLTSGEKKPDA